jgi:hypothetical protein
VKQTVAVVHLVCGDSIKLILTHADVRCVGRAVRVAAVVHVGETRCRWRRWRRHPRLWCQRRCRWWHWRRRRRRAWRHVRVVVIVVQRVAAVRRSANGVAILVVACTPSIRRRVLDKHERATRGASKSSRQTVCLAFRWELPVTCAYGRSVTRPFWVLTGCEVGPAGMNIRWRRSWRRRGRRRGRHSSTATAHRRRVRV